MMVEQLIEQAQEAERAGAWDAALAAYEAALHQLAPEHGTARAAEILRWIGTVHRCCRDFDAAEDVYHASCAVATAGGHLDHIAACTNCFAVVQQMRGALDRAEMLYAQARVEAEQAGAERLAAMIDQNLGVLANVRGSFATALVNYGSALDRYRRIGDGRSAAGALNNMGMLHVDLEEWERAETCFLEAQRLATDARDQTLVGTIELNRAELHLKRQRFEQARHSCDRAFAIFKRLGGGSPLAEAHKFYGVLYRETARPHLAEIHLGLAVRIAAACGDRLLEAEAASEWAIVQMGAGRGRESVRLLNRAHRLFSGLQAKREVLDIERRFQELRRTYLAVVQAWRSEAIDPTDEHTPGHCRRVAEYATALAQRAGFQGEDLTWFRIGALLHDVGKTALPADLLGKEGALTLEEWALMRHHTLLGDEIVADLEFPWDIRPMVRSHHEHWDGGGYPDGLRGEEIPLAARVLAVADAYDALTTARSYRPSFSPEEALRLMERERGRLLDPDLLDLFHEVMAERFAIGQPQLRQSRPLS
jgi:putative nucleotidyltransferase with HDIG domain